MVGLMPQDDKYIFNKIDGLRIYADQHAEIILARMRENEEDAREYASRAFRNPDFVSAMFYASAEGYLKEDRLRDTAEALQRDPEAFSKLRGFWFSPNASRAAQPHIDKLADCLREHADLVVIRTRYQQLHQQAIEATRLHAGRRVEALRELEHGRDFCDATRDVRLQHRAVEPKRAAL